MWIFGFVLPRREVWTLREKEGRTRILWRGPDQGFEGPRPVSSIWVKGI